MSEIVSLKEDPRRFLLNRANRLARLAVHVAPANILQAEVTLVAQAMDEIARQENTRAKPTSATETLLLRHQIERCMDMLGDVPGDNIEERLGRLISWYLDLQTECSKLREFP